MTRTQSEADDIAVASPRSSILGRAYTAPELVDMAGAACGSQGPVPRVGRESSTG